MSDPIPDGGLAFSLAGEPLVATPAGALWLPARRALAVADLHLGKAERIARGGGALTPPYENRETLERLGAEIARLDPAEVICIGDSFDDDAAARALDDPTAETLTVLAAGRVWVWIAGNHDPAPVALGGTCRAERRLGPLILRHMAEMEAEAGEVSGHYHPKALLQMRGRRVRRRCFLVDARRVILPAFGAYTGGLSVRDPALARLMGPEARALILGRKVSAAPLGALAA